MTDEEILDKIGKAKIMEYVKRKGWIEEKTEDKSNVPYSEILKRLNDKTGSKFREVEKTKRLINSRWGEGYTLEDFYTVIDNMTAKWLNDSRMSRYLRPETLLGTKFESYLNEKVTLADRKVVSKNAETSMNNLRTWKNAKP